MIAFFARDVCIQYIPSDRLFKQIIMRETIIIGHKNPDTDSVCAAYCYAALKAIIDPSRPYVAGRCGNLNRQTRFVFERTGVEPPRLFSDIYHRVSDVMTRGVVSMRPCEPVFRAMKNIEERKIRILPVSEDGNYLGLVSLHEIADFLISDDIDKKPEYLFRADNFDGVLNGRLYAKGTQHEFTARLTIGAMPFDTFKRFSETYDPAGTVLIVGKRSDIIEFAATLKFPAIVVTGIPPGETLGLDTSGFRGWIYLTEMETAETFRRLMLSTPVGSIMNTGVPSLSPDEQLDAARDTLMNLDHRGVPVLEEGRLVGVLTRSDLIRQNARRLILVDHNELSQAVDGAENAEICEIIDHHRLGTIKTRTPIYVYAKPVGSTCTLVHQLFAINGITADSTVAYLLLAGILSDTALLKSPTTTSEDVRAVEELASATGLDYKMLGAEIFGAAENLLSRDPASVISSDFKIYREFGVAVGIGQVEVVSLDTVEEVSSNLMQALLEAGNRNNLDWAMLLITDIVSQNSVLLSSGFTPAERRLSYNRTSDGMYSLPGVLSRKKQLLPEVLRILEELARAGGMGRR